MKCFLTCLVSIIIILSQSSCGSGKKITKAIAKNDSTISVIKVNDNTNIDSINKVNETLQKMQNNFINFNTFSAKLKVEYDAPDQKVPDLSVFLRMQKDSVIWLNIIALEVVNVAKILITKDSFFVLDKRENTYLRRPIKYIQQISQIPFDFKTLQDLLIGNPVYFQKPINTFKQNENTITMLSLGAFFKNLITLNNESYTVTHSKLDDVDVNRNRTCDLSYSDYEKNEKFFFAKDRNITISEKSKITIDINFKNYKFNEVLTFPFTVPKKYKVL